MKTIIVVLIFLAGSSAFGNHERLNKGILPRDTDWPPIQDVDPYNCLESGRNSPDFEDELYETIGGKTQDCPLVTDDICQESQFYPVPCNCHAYVECSQYETGQPIACVKKCEPYDLIYDPAFSECVYYYMAHPGLCADTHGNSTIEPPMTTPDPTTQDPTTQVPTTQDPTTPAPTTEDPTTADPTTADPTTPVTTAPETTTNPIIPDCEYFGHTFPYPGDCHLYYICLPDSEGNFDVDVFDCGDMIYDPNQAACVFASQELEDILCGPAGL